MSDARRLKARSGDRLDAPRAFEFVSDHRAEFAVQRMCRTLGVSTSGYYAWCQREPSTRSCADETLERRIMEIDQGSRMTGTKPPVRAEGRSRLSITSTHKAPPDSSCHVQISAVAHDHGECHESDGKSAAKNGTKRGTRQALAGRNWHYMAQASSTRSTVQPASRQSGG